MRAVHDEIVLAQPAPAFGAVKGKNKYTRWYFVTAALAVFLLSPLLFLGTGYTYAGMVAFFGVAAAVWFFYTYSVFTYADQMFWQDAVAGKREWVRTELRSYLNRKYMVDMSANEVENLMYYSGSHVYRQHEGSTQRVSVVLDGAYEILNSVPNYEKYVGEIPDVSRFNIKLLIVERPAQPKIYEFCQD